MAAFSDAAFGAVPSMVVPSTHMRHPALAAGLSRHAEAGTQPADIAALRPDGRRVDLSLPIADLPAVQQAFSAFARGTVLQSAEGAIAVEDLVPGDMLRTSDGRMAQVTWIATVPFAATEGRDGGGPLVRIAPDSLGEGRPDSFLTLGPGAHILHTPAHLRARRSHPGLLTPVRAFLDAVNVCEITPPGPLRLFHIMLDRHACIRAGGLDCDTYHPGDAAMETLSTLEQARFLSLFPNLSGFTDFGRLSVPRMADTNG